MLPNMILVPFYSYTRHSTYISAPLVGCFTFVTVRVDNDREYIAYIKCFHAYHCIRSSDNHIPTNVCQQKKALEDVIKIARKDDEIPLPEWWSLPWFYLDLPWFTTHVKLWAWIRNHTCVTLCYIVTHPRPNMYSGVAKPTFKLNCGWIIKTHINSGCDYLFIP